MNVKMRTLFPISDFEFLTPTPIKDLQSGPIFKLEWNHLKLDLIIAI